MKIKKRKVSDIQSVIMAALSLMTVVISVTIGLLLYNRYEMLIRQNDIKDTQEPDGASRQYRGTIPEGYEEDF